MTATTAICLDAAAAARLMPMHLSLDAAGRITGIGPTLAKVLGPGIGPGADFFAVFAIRRPAGLDEFQHLRARAGDRLHLELRGSGAVPLRGLALPTTGGGVVINLGFGIGLIEAVRQHGLTDADFAATDLAVEMLYLVEVKAAVMAELKRLNLRLHGAKLAAEEQALTDTLTGLRNRRALDMALAALIGQGVAFGLMHIDLDYFKQVNDTLGHAAGDAVLRAVARCLTDETRAEDTVARVGGDEFVIVFPGRTDAAQLSQIARRIIAGLGEPIDFEGQPCRISASIGITLSTHYARPDAETMLTDADAALYASKRNGRSQAQLFQPDVGGRLTA